MQACCISSGNSGSVSSTRPWMSYRGLRRDLLVLLILQILIRFFFWHDPSVFYFGNLILFFASAPPLCCLVLLFPSLFLCCPMRACLLTRCFPCTGSCKEDPQLDAANPFDAESVVESEPFVTAWVLLVVGADAGFGTLFWMGFALFCAHSI